MSRATFRKVITSEELISQINPKNVKLMNRFLKNFNTKRSDKSVKVYHSNFNIFFCWNVENNDNKFFIDIRKSEFADFFDYCVLELKWSPNRYANMWSSLNSLSNFIENILDDDYPDFRNQVKKIEKLPKNTVRKKTVLTDKQVDNLMYYLSEVENKPQEALLLALAISSGARISELFRFTTDLIDEENTAFNGLFLETKDMIKTKGFGKQGELKYKYIIKDIFLPKYKVWLPIRKEVMKKNNQNHNYIFIKKDGSPATPETARVWMKRWEKFLTEDKDSNPSGEAVNLYPHCFRHRIVTYLSKLGLEADFIIEIMGWKSRDMYDIYNDLTAKDKEWKNLDVLKNILEKNTEEENKTNKQNSKNNLNKSKNNKKKK